MSRPPDWVRDIAEAARRLGAEDLSRSLPPPPASARDSAVLVLFAQSSAGAELVLIERAHDMRSHPGQLAFPGGGADADETAAQTALREAEEEIGLDPVGVDVLAELPALWLPPSNFAVTCVLAWWREESPVGVVDPVEVADVLRVPIDELVDPRHRVTVRHPMGYRGPGFVLGDLVLWGFTASVVDTLLDHGGLAEPWDPARTLSAPEPAPVSAPGADRARGRRSAR